MTDCNETKCEFTPTISKPNIIMVSLEECSHCGEAKNELRNEIDSGKINVLSEKDAIAYMVKHKLGLIPTFIIDGKQCDFIGNKEFDCNGEKVKI